MKKTIVNNVIVSKWCKLSPDKDSDETKSFKIELSISGVTIEDMANGLLKNEVIRWQNAKRSKYDKLVDKSTHKLTFKAPIGQIDPETAMVEKLKAMSPEEQSNYLADLMNKVQ